MKENFAASLADVLDHEGGWSNDPQDPGGATMKGITQREYDSWRSRQGLPFQSVRLIGPDDLAAIYRSDYWNACSCDQLPGGVDYATFDFCVNSGAHRAAQCLQQAAAVDADGRIGPATIAACQAADTSTLISALCSERHAYLERLKTFGHFGHGWTARVDEVEDQAKAMVA